MLGKINIIIIIIIFAFKNSKHKLQDTNLCSDIENTSLKYAPSEIIEKLAVGVQSRHQVVTQLFRLQVQFWFTAQMTNYKCI